MRQNNAYETIAQTVYNRYFNMIQYFVLLCKI